MLLIPDIIWLVVFPSVTVTLQPLLHRKNVSCDEHGKLDPINNDSSLNKDDLVSELGHACRNLNITRGLLIDISDEVDVLKNILCEIYKCLDDDSALDDFFPGLNASQYVISNKCIKVNETDHDGCNIMKHNCSCGPFNFPGDWTSSPTYSKNTTDSSRPCTSGVSSDQSTMGAGVTLRDVTISVVSFAFGAVLMYIAWFTVRRRESSRRKSNEQNMADNQQAVFSISTRDSRNETKNVYSEVDYPAMELEGATARNNEAAGRTGNLSEVSTESREILPDVHVPQCPHPKIYSTLSSERGDKHLYAINESGDAIYTPKERTEDSDKIPVNNTYAILLPEGQTSKKQSKVSNNVNADQETKGVDNNAACKEMGETNCCYESMAEDKELTTGASGGAISDEQNLVPFGNHVKPKARLSAVVPAPNKDKMDRTSFHEYYKLEES